MESRQIAVDITAPGFRSRRIVTLTTLLDAGKHPTADFALPYRQRWQVELEFRHIKTTMGFATLRCPPSVRDGGTPDPTAPS